MSVGLRGANRLKFAEMIASQSTSTARNRMGIELPAWTNNAKRGRAKSVVRLDALGGQFHGGRQVIDAPIRDGGRAAR